MKVIASDALPSEANKIKSYNENLLSDINKLSALNDSVTSFWQGEDAVAFSSKVNEFIPTLNKLHDTVDDYAIFLSKVNSAFDSIDEYYDKEIDV